MNNKKFVVDALALAGITVGGNKPWDIQVHNEKFYDQVLAYGSLAMGETYVDGWWDGPNIDETLSRMLRANLQNKVKVTFTLAWAALKARLFNQQTKSKSREVIDEHYNLSPKL